MRISAFGVKWTSAMLLWSLAQERNANDHERQYEDRHDFNWIYHALPLGVAADRVQARFQRGFSPYAPANRLPRLAAHASASSLDPMATIRDGVPFRLNPSSTRISGVGSSSRRGGDPVSIRSISRNREKTVVPLLAESKCEVAADGLARSKCFPARAELPRAYRTLRTYRWSQ